MERNKLLLILTLLVSIVMPAHAVFDEQNIEQNLHVLHYELKDRFVNIGRQNKLQRDRTKARTQMMKEVRRQSNIIAMMLYSQKVEYIFGLTYACDKATDLYTNYVETMNPLIVQENVNANDVIRYDSLIMVMNRINPSTLSPTSKQERIECIYWASMIKAITIKREANTKKSVAEYNATKRFLYNLEQYAQNRYKFVQNKLFNNGSETFYHILQHWDERWPYLKMVTMEEYVDGDEVPSDWGFSIRKSLFICFCIGVIVAIFLGWVISLFVSKWKSENSFIRLLKEWLEECHMCFVMTCAALLFAITVNIIRLFVVQNFLEMALDLMGAFFWIFTAILLSSFFMKEGKNVKQSMYLYLTVLFSGLFVIFLRVNLFPNLVVAFTLPPLILICALWEAITLYRVWKHIGKIDRVLALITEAIYIYLIFCSWNGYILFSVQILIWWMMQLAFILVLTSIGMYMKSYAVNHDIHSKPIKKSWLYYFVCMFLCPVAAIYSLIFSTYWAGEVFNLEALVTGILETNLTDNNNAIISLWTIVKIVNLWLVARFIYFFAKQMIMQGYSHSHITFEQGQNIMYTKVIQIFVYGVWFLISMYMLHVSMTWIAAAGAGLATGLGFASKTILENVFYGISLLSGRLKIGDLIKVGDVYGNVLNINYSSTVIRNDDGTVVTFTNSQLIEMNYRNLTRIDEFNKQLLYLNVNIKSNIAQIRKIIIDATSSLPCLHLHELRNGKPAYQVGVRTTGINSFELASCIIIEVSYWVDPNTEKRDIGIVTECIINALRDNQIEIL